MRDEAFPYAATPDYQAIELPYGGEAFAMTVVLPAEGTGIDAFVESLDVDAWADIIAGLGETQLLVALPKFRLEYEKNLNDVLKALGMEEAFNPAVADFSRMHRDALAMPGAPLGDAAVYGGGEGSERGVRGLGGGIPPATIALI